MTAKVFTSIPYGFDGHIIEVECAITQGLPLFDIVGMANKTVSEARQRVRNAIKNSGLKWPDSHITINLAPAELLKDGNFFDVPIAIAILVASGQLLESDVKDNIFTGELSLDGKIRPVRGMINILEAGNRANFKRFFIPFSNLSQASLFSNAEIYGASNLLELVLSLKGQDVLPSIKTHNVVKNNITEAIERQQARYKDQTTYNANLSSSQVVKYIELDKSARTLLDQASEKLNLSARSYFKVIKVARTIADLKNEDLVKAPHIIEALTYRMEL